MSKNKRYKRKIKKLEKQRNFYINYTNNLKNEWYDLNNENYYNRKELSILKIDLYICKNFIKVLAAIAVFELLIILF